MPLKDVVKLDDINEVVKPYIRVEHNADDVIIELITNAVIARADTFLNREFPVFAEELHDIRLILLQAIAHLYENRGDLNELPQPIMDALRKYRFEPGF